MEDARFKDLKFKFLDFQGKVMIIVATNATNKVLDETVSTMEQWNKELFKGIITKQGFMLEYVDLNTY